MTSPCRPIKCTTAYNAKITPTAIKAADLPCANKNTVAESPYRTAKIPSPKYRNPRPSKSANTNVRKGTWNTPSAKIKTLNGKGGGKIAGTNTLKNAFASTHRRARTACFPAFE